MKGELGTLLIVEDNPDDYEATVRSLQNNHFANPIKWCGAGQDAWDYLMGEGKYTDQGEYARPLLILLDLNMPGLDGRALLSKVKANPALSSIPVIVLTTSADPSDIDACYDAGASSYIQKPVNFDGLEASMRAMAEFWFGVALLPKSEDA